MFSFSLDGYILWLLQHIPMMLVHLVIIAGIVAFFVGRYTPLIPDKLLIKVAGILVFCFGLVLEGATVGADMLKPQLAKEEAEIARINTNAQNITKEVQIQYVDRVKVIKEKGNEILKYINTNNDRDCKLYNSTVMLLDAAAKNEVPNTTTGIDGTTTAVGLSDNGTSTVKLSDEERVIAGNYEKYHLVAQELTSLQEWVKQQQKNNQ